MNLGFLITGVFIENIIFIVLDQKYPFWANLVKRIKIVNLTWNLEPRLYFVYAEFNGDNHFFCFRRRIPFLRKFGPKIQNCLFKVKLGIKTISNMQNFIIIFTFSVFIEKYPFWANLFQKVKTVSLNWNLITRLIRICRIQW